MSEDFFFLIDNDGGRRIPYKKSSRDGRYGYNLLPPGKGNDISSAEVTEDEKRMVQGVVLDSLGVRARAESGQQAGQGNTLYLYGQRPSGIRGYWLAPHLRHWVAGAKQQSEELPGREPSPEEDITNATNLPGDATEREAVIQARRGQGKFRFDLIAEWGSCAITGCTHPDLLRASHIKPWRDSSNAERLSIDNGLLLSANLDAAFDKGLISFDDDGRILISARLSASDATAAGINSGMRLRSLRLGNRPFLASHRASFGFT